jgi:hypothetical protein
LFFFLSRNYSNNIEKEEVLEDVICRKHRQMCMNIYALISLYTEMKKTSIKTVKARKSKRKREDEDRKKHGYY